MGQARTRKTRPAARRSRVGKLAPPRHALPAVLAVPALAAQWVALLPPNSLGVHGGRHDRDAQGSSEAIVREALWGWPG